jgi:KDO2-lipid IV(A) lauroyltransferase
MTFRLFSGLVWLISLLPARVLVWKSYALGWLAWVLSKTKRNSTLKNLAACYPHLDESGRRKAGKESMRHYILLALETGIGWYWSKRRFLALCEPPVGLEAFERTQQEGRGVVLLVPHFGNWELLNQWLQCVLELGNVSLYKPGRYPDFEEKLYRKRQRFGGTMAPTTRSGIRTLLKYLKEGRVAIVLPDQDPSEGQGRFAPFFGIQTLTPVLGSRLCSQTGSKAFFAVCKRVPGGRFQVHLIPADDDFYSTDLDASLTAMNRGLETCIALDPPQYLWAYKRFKTRPEGEPRFYGG